MYRVEVTDDTAEVAAEARAEMRRIGPALRRIGRETAMKMRRTHPYRNRTGRTQAATGTVTEERGGDVYMRVHVAVDHATYLEGTKRRPDDILGARDAGTAASAEIHDLMHDLKGQ